MKTFIKKHIVLVVSGVVVLVLLIITSVKLISSVRHYSKEKWALRIAMIRLEQLYNRDPYPSLENVKKESENLEELQNVYSALNESLRIGQIDPEQMEAADFMPLLENTLRRLKKRLKDARVIFPPRFTFGFEKYAGGRLPSPVDIPQLVQQLKIIEKLCNLLTEADIIELVSISREVFESDARFPTSRSRGSGRRRGAAKPAPLPPEDQAEQPELYQLYTTQHFTIVFRGREDSVCDLLNRLASHEMFNIVTYVQMANKKHGFRERMTSGSFPKPALASGPAGTTEKAPRDRRIVLGKEDLEVKLEVDVYQFAPAEEGVSSQWSGDRTTFNL